MESTRSASVINNNNEKCDEVSLRTDYKSNLSEILHDQNVVDLERRLITRPATSTIRRPCLFGTQTLSHQQSEEENGDHGSASVMSDYNCCSLETAVMKPEYHSVGVKVGGTASPRSEGGPTIRCNSVDKYDWNAMIAESHVISPRVFQTLDYHRATEVVSTGATDKKSEDVCYWTGTLPFRKNISGNISRKVFVYGLPYGITESGIMEVFCRFGQITVIWPKPDGVHLSSEYNNRGYCYLVYENEACVLELLRNSFRTRRIDSDFYRIPLYNFPFRYAKVVPWSIEDTNYCGPTGSSANMQYAIYVGQLHGLMTAKGLANIMDDLFGNVVSATLHTDQYKYPTGSARVIFSSSESYLKAIITQSITIHTSKFTKTIQVHPYLGNTLCNVCLKSPGIYFCRALQCFKYFCLSCWNGFHQNVTENFSEHKPLKR
uniref:RRM domain-containing protein n=2 Tax=Trichobilharzia regenti TaxID=157069 RepID=A0AA85JIY9_TRIRE|nr:unnamed protein product [Trichobilharzia regenti]